MHRVRVVGNRKVSEEQILEKIQTEVGAPCGKTFYVKIFGPCGG